MGTGTPRMKHSKKQTLGGQGIRKGSGSVRLSPSCKMGHAMKKFGNHCCLPLGRGHQSTAKASEVEISERCILDWYYMISCILSTHVKSSVSGLAREASGVQH
ncbi:hypothetical protein KIL84_018813 [Mauremys mutica]|uniref:Uncharacterized protein n=1 Tax=Mauremys mutica TaxID=74926 RepID=A0A9D3XSN9_9SAUR|nr:hypothetical protein KIL84_018813 [Mauremys mutica]